MVLQRYPDQVKSYLMKPDEVAFNLALEFSDMSKDKYASNVVDALIKLGLDEDHLEAILTQLQQYE